MNWKNRIVGSETVDPATLKPHDLNWRDHPIAQQQALDVALEGVGWIKEVIVSKRTGTILDGHLRVERAFALGEMVPVVYVDVSKNEEKAILATMDPLADAAGIDREKLTDLMQSIDGDREELAKLRALMADAHGLDVPEFDPQTPPEGGEGDEPDKRIRCPRCSHAWLPEANSIG